MQLRYIDHQFTDLQNHTKLRLFMARIIVYGGGGFGLEIIGYLRDLREYSPMDNDSPELVGIIDQGVARQADAEAIHGSALTFWGSEDEVNWQADDQVLIAVGEPVVRHRLFNQLSARGIQFFTLIHPTACIASTATIGKGSILAPFSFVGSFAALGPNTVLNTYSSAGHDCIIGAASVLSPYAALNGSVEIGLAVYLGSGSIVLPGLVVGQNSKISAGSIVSRDVGVNSLVAGNPAKSRVMFSDIND